MFLKLSSKISLVKDMAKDDGGNEVQDNEAQGNENQEVEVEPTQPLPKDWRFNPHHPKDSF